MIEAKRLLDDLKRLLRRLEDDLRERSRTVETLNDALQHEYQPAREAGRTGEAFEAWREGMLTQAAVAWLLGCVFVRFTEDNGLVDQTLLSGPHERRYEASATGLSKFPVAKQKPETLPRLLNHLSPKRQTYLPAQLIEHFPLSRTALVDHQAKAAG